MISPMIVFLFNTLAFTFPKHAFDQINIGFGLMDFFSIYEQNAMVFYK